MIEVLGRHVDVLVYVGAAVVALALSGAGMLIRRVKAGGERWDQRSEQERRRLSLLPGVALVVVVVGVIVITGGG